jgi:penicillin-binding protein 1A
LKDTKELKLTSNNLQWVIKNKNIKSAFKKGDVILLNKSNRLMQIPKVNGAIVVIENKSGKILTLVGGYDLRQSNFNRAIQAKRQPGSVFKTFVYLAALEQGEEPNTHLLDEPIEIELGHGLPNYTPRNYKDTYQGIVTLRRSFERSMNLSTIRLLMGIGLESLKEVAIRYKIYPDNIKATYSMALGAYETTLLKMTNAYASIGNGGIMMKPKLIESIYNRQGNLIYASKDIFCENCSADVEVQDTHPKIRVVGQVMTDPATNYQVLSLLEGAVQRGSARRAKWLNKVIAGKTGTTNDSKDTWFIGITPDITVGVYIGYDEPKSLGKNMSGSNLALPIFNNFITQLKDLPDRPFAKPEAIEEKYILLEEGDIISEQQAERLSKSRAVFKEVFKKHRNKSVRRSLSGKDLFREEKLDLTAEDQDIFSFAEPYMPEEAE